MHCCKLCCLKLLMPVGQANNSYIKKQIEPHHSSGLYLRYKKQVCLAWVGDWWRLEEMLVYPVVVMGLLYGLCARKTCNGIFHLGRCSQTPTNPALNHYTGAPDNFVVKYLCGSSDIF